MDPINIIIIIITIIAIYIIKKNKFDKNKEKQAYKHTDNISVESDDQLLEVLKKKCDSKCLVCYGLVELFKNIVNEIGIENAVKYISSNPSLFTSKTGEYIYIWKYIPKTDQYYFVYHPSKYTNEKTAVEAQFDIDKYVCIDKTQKCNIRENCKNMLKTLQESKVKKSFFYYDWYDPIMKIKIKKKTYSELIGDNTVVTCSFFHNRKPEQFDLLQFIIQISGMLMYLLTLYFINIDKIFHNNNIYKYIILILTLSLFLFNLHFSNTSTQNTKSELQKLDYVNSTAIKISAFGLSLWVFNRGIQEFLNDNQKYKFVSLQVLAVVFGVLSLFSARTSNEPFYIKIQTMIKTNFLLVSLCYVLIAITFSLTIIKPYLNLI